MSSWMLAKTVVSVLCDAGVTDVVLAPGSRSAAVAIALERAERAGALRLHVRVDERSAAFLALGLAKSTGRVVPVVCTSGTAVGNLLPAAMEAGHAGVPLLLLSCDRPAYRIGTGASQTTDQAGILGRFAVADIRLSSSSGRPAYWAAAVTRGLAAALGTRTRRPGPTQINLEFSNPMLPEPEDGSYRLDRDFRMNIAPTSGGVVLELPVGRRTVVLAGDASPTTGAAARAFAEEAGLPLFAEPSSNARGGANAISTYRILLDGPLRSEVDRVITFGHPTLSRPVAALLSDPAVEQIVVADGADWPDVGATASAVADRVLLARSDDGWLSSWLKADADVLPRLAAIREGLNGYAVADAVVASVLDGDNLVLGSSNPIRDADLARLHDGSPLVWANRGLAGIDGTIATATGIALGTGRATTLLLGDLTFIHDVGSLCIGAGHQRPRLRIVVADDDGGSIFHTLEQGASRFADSFERVFATPQGLDLVAVAAGFGVAARRVTEWNELERALSLPIEGVELLVVQLERASRRVTDAVLRDLAVDDQPES